MESVNQMPEQPKELLAYDIEVFSHDALVIFKTMDKKVAGIFHNNFEGIRDLIKDKILVGYNIYNYDDFILSRMIEGWTPELLKKLNDTIIRGDDHPKYIDPAIDSLDCFQEIHVSRPSLKRIEGNMGRMIFESSVPFDIDRPLTSEELDEVIKYCSYDVDMVIEVYKLREKNYFKSKNQLLKLAGNSKAKRWNTTTISANILVKKPLPKWSGLRIPEEWLELVSPDVADMWISKSKSLTGEIYKKTVTITEFDNDIQFSLGGLHGAHKWKKRIENVKVLDVASMYPSIIINLQALGPATSLYKELKDRRLEVKHSDKALSDALKLVLNSVYGNLKNQYSLLNNPNASLTVCAYGQIALYTLCKALSQVADIININTDGVIFSSDTDDYKKIAEEWEKEFNLTLEEDTYDLFIQKDVNNYIAVKGDYSKFRGAESIKCKGGDVSRYSHDSLFSNNNTRILDIALVDYLVYGKDVLDTLLENLDKPRLYQYILQAGSTFEGTFDDKGNQYNKINRVFATKKGDLVLQKRRYDGALIRFPDAPERMYLWNDDCDNIQNFNRIIDLNHYYQIIKSRLERWKYKYVYGIH